MKTILSSLIIALTTIVLVGCSSNNSPIDVYEKYHEACWSGDIGTASGLLTKHALSLAYKWDDYCMFLHDWYTYNGLDGEEFLTDPEEFIIGNTAAIIWKYAETSQITGYNETIMLMLDDGWKIDTTNSWRPKD